MITNKLKMLALAALSASALGVAACSEGTPSASSPASIRTEPATTTTSERVFQANADTVTLIDVALVFAYLQVGADATPEAIVEAINSLTGETLTVADFDDPFPTFAEASGYIAPADSVDLNDVAAFFAVLQGADGEDAVAAAVAQLTGSAFDASSIIVLPGSGTTTASPSPSPSPTAPPLPMPEEGETFTIFVNPDATTIGNGSEATPFSTVASANTFAIGVQDEVDNVDLIISVIAPGEEDVDGTLDLGETTSATGTGVQDSGGTRTLTSVDGFTINLVAGGDFIVSPETSVISTDFNLDGGGALTVTDGTFTGPSTVDVADSGPVIFDGTGDVAVSATTFIGDSDNTGPFVSLPGSGDVVFDDVNLATGEAGLGIDVTMTAGSFAYMSGEVEVAEDSTGIQTDAVGELTIDGVTFTLAESSDPGTTETIGVFANSATTNTVTVSGSTFSIADGGLGVTIAEGNADMVANAAVIEGSSFTGTTDSFAIAIDGSDVDLLTQYEDADNTFTGFSIANGAIRQD